MDFQDKNGNFRVQDFMIKQRNSRIWKKKLKVEISGFLGASMVGLNRRIRIHVKGFRITLCCLNKVTVPVF
jgi:hypothetical protein